MAGVTSSFRDSISTRPWLAFPWRPGYFRNDTWSRKEGCAVTIFRHYRQRGPVNALQMRLQGW